MPDGDDKRSDVPAHALARVFVGVKIVPKIADEFSQIAKALEKFSVRLIAAADIHLTLVPPWNESSHAQAIEKLRAAAGSVDDLALTFTHVGYGPDPRRPCHLWVDWAENKELAVLRAKLLTVFGQNE